MGVWLGSQDRLVRTRPPRSSHLGHAAAASRVDTGERWGFCNRMETSCLPLSPLGSVHNLSFSGDHRSAEPKSAWNPHGQGVCASCLSPSRSTPSGRRWEWMVSEQIRTCKTATECTRVLIKFLCGKRFAEKAEGIVKRNFSELLARTERKPCLGKWIVGTYTSPLMTAAS